MGTILLFVGAYAACSWATYEMALSFLRIGFDDAFNAECAPKDMETSLVMAIFGPLGLAVVSFYWIWRTVKAHLDKRAV